MKKKILVLAPHADDEILGCGGSIAKFSRLGYEVFVLILTNGNEGAPELFSKKEIEIIRNESKIANKIIGTKKLIFENLPALILNNYPIYKIANLIKKHIDQINPNIIFIPSNIDIHLDHKIIFVQSCCCLKKHPKLWLYCRCIDNSYCSIFLKRYAVQTKYCLQRRHANRS